MVEPQPSKLVVRVRFPSPAPAAGSVPGNGGGAGLCDESYCCRKELTDGEGEIRAYEAALQHWDDWPCGPWQDVFDGCDHEGIGGEGRGDVYGVRRDRQGAGGEGAWDHDFDVEIGRAHV